MIEKHLVDQINQLVDFKQKIYQAALMYATAGIKILPLQKGDKRLPPKDTGINYGTCSRNPKVIDKWFNPVTGRFPGWNIGIACGTEDGVFALDVDCGGGKTGDLELESLQEEHGKLPGTPVQVTPGGGRHYLFRWSSGAASSTSKIAKHIDTRGGTDRASKGHIVAWPSVVNGKSYEWESFGNLEDIPFWVLEKMGSLTKWGAPPGRGNEMMEESDLEKQIPSGQIEDMLGFINPDDLSYDEWLKVGMAIKSQYPGNDGFILWDSWSSMGDRYEPSECRVRWDGIDPTGSIRAGTLFYFARRGGWDPKPEDVVNNPWDEIVDRLNNDYAIVSVGGKIRVLMDKGETMDHEDPFVFLSKDDFKTLMENKTHAWVNPQTGKAVIRTEAEIWLAHQRRREFPRGIGMYPEGAPTGVYNTWRGFTVTPSPGDVQLYLDHVFEVICGGNTEVYEWVLDWIADLFQDPSNPKGTAIVMKGDEGTGKGSFVRPLGKIFGPHFTHIIDSGLLSGRFTGHFAQTVLMFADEVVWGGDKKGQGKLNGMVTERGITIESKGVDAYKVRNMCHIIMASNNDWVVPAGQNSRRWCVLRVSDKRMQNREYFRPYAKWVKDTKNLQSLLHFFLNREVLSDLTNAPHTQELQVQRVLHVQDDPVIRWWNHCISTGIIDVADEAATTTDTDWPRVIDRILTYSIFEDWALRRNYRHIPSQSVFNRRMKNFGFKVIRPAATASTTRRYKFKVPPYDEAVKIASKFIDTTELQEFDDE